MNANKKRLASPTPPPLQNTAHVTVSFITPPTTEPDPTTHTTPTQATSSLGSGASIPV